MAAQTDVEELRTAWAALCASPAADGSTSIVLSAGPRFRAGAVWPGGHETLLVGFSGVTLPPKSELPEGRGFAVRAAPQPAGQGHDVWIALTRQIGGADDLFSRMAADVVDSVAAQATRGERLNDLISIGVPASLILTAGSLIGITLPEIAGLNYEDRPWFTFLFLMSLLSTLVFELG